MDLKDIDRLEELFHRSKDLSDAELAQFLDDECREQGLRVELESLLEAHRMAEGQDFLGGTASEDVPAADDVAGPDPHLLLGKNVGPYKVERFLGGGGMGDVYLAVRQSPFKILVGLKILRRGLRTDEVLRRFDVERQILASLNHPNIARLLDGGVTDGGLPYFAMEYIDGMPITRYADRNRLTIADRLELFRDVCAAVNYAHQNLVIHRDLKPTNIFVNRNGSVKLLDFGIAKIINPNLADLATPVTQTRFRMLTPDYASPEQVRAEPLSTASDVYSLGVILYELLSGNRPYRLEGNTAVEIERLVCDVDPPVPSRNAMVVPPETLVNSTDAVAHARQTTPDRLVRQLRGDLDNIVMMALRKESGRRYQSVEQLTADIGRYISGRPVHAAADSRIYRGLKFVKRNAVVAGASAAVALLLLGFSIFSSVQAKKLRLERDRVQLEAQKSQQVSDFVVGLFDTANPASAPGDTVTVRSILEAGVARAERELADRPTLQAELFGVIGRAYENLGRHRRAVELIRQAVDLRRDRSGEVDGFLTDLKLLAALRADIGETEQSILAYNEFIERGTQRFGSDHPQVLLERLNLLAVTHARQPGVGADSILAIWNRLSTQLDGLTDADAAEVLSYVSDIYFARGEYSEAEQVALRAVDYSIREYGEESTQLGSLYNQLGRIYIEIERGPAAYEMGRRAASVNEKLYPDGHRNLAVSYGIQGYGLGIMGRYDEAEELLQRDLAMTRRVLGENSFAVGRPLRFLGVMHRRKGDLDAAIAYYQQDIDLLAERFGPDYLFVRQRGINIAEILVEKGDFAQAESMLLSTYKLFSETRGDSNAATIDVAGVLAKLYEQTGRAEEADKFSVLANIGVSPVAVAEK